MDECASYQVGRAAPGLMNWSNLQDTLTATGGDVNRGPACGMGTNPHWHTALWAEQGRRGFASCGWRGRGPGPLAPHVGTAIDRGRGLSLFEVSVTGCRCFRPDYFSGFRPDCLLL